jgi:hypothetical protein
MTSPERAPARELETAPARPKRTTHRIVYSPELLAELRHLYERTPETCDDIALRRGISRPTLRLLAKRQGWVRFQRRPLDLSPAVKLEARLAEAVQSAPAKPGAAPDNANSFDAAFRLTAAAALEEAQAQIDALKAARLQLEETGRFEKFSQLGRDLAAITNSLYRIKRMHGGATQDLLPDDDMLSDLDARRDALARRIDAILAQWMDAAARGHMG